MAWNPAISVAFEAGNAEEFARLLRAHPEFLRDEADGSDMWLWRACMDGDLPIVKVLVELGMDVNESSDPDDDPDDPFYEPEGPIVHAAGEGHFELVGWLLEQGAKINYVVQGKPRCRPLVRAATSGHLDVVKLLVEHGADIHATWRGVNAVTQAEDFGHFAIRDYLRSLGARTLYETTPSAYPSAHERFLKNVTGQHGPLGEWRLDVPGDPLVTIHVIPPNEKCDVQTLFTVGLSDHRLCQGQRQHACTELRCLLPRDWPLTDAALQERIWNWPIEWLKRFVNDIRVASEWPEEPVIVMNDEPPVPLAQDTQLSGWICMKELGESVRAPDRRYIDIHAIVPIYAEERALVEQSGYEELIDRFLNCDIPLYIDPKRLNVAVQDDKREAAQ